MGSQMAVRFSALRAGRGRLLLLILEAESTSAVIVRLEELGKLKNPMTTSGIETKTFLLAA
jgi:hypothetical protein